MEGYRVTQFQTTLQRSWERWLSQPSPTTERLVDQALIASGRQPMFSMSGRYGGGVVQPFQVPNVGRAYAQSQLVNAARAAVGRSPTMGYRGEPFSSENFAFRPYAPRGGAFRQQGMSTTNLAMFAGHDVGKLLKHMDQTLDSMNRVEHRLLYLSESTAGTRGGPIPNRIANAINLANAGLTARHGTPRAPVSIGAALGQAMAGRIGGVGGVPPMGGGGGGGGGFGGGGGGGGFGGAFAGGAIGAGLRRHPLAVGALAGWEALHWPTLLGSFAEGEWGRSAGFVDMRRRAAQMTRLPASIEQSGRARRMRMEGELLPHPGEGAVPGWMRELGLTQPMALDLLRQMGGGQQVGTDQLGLVRQARTLQLGAGFAMAPEAVPHLMMMGQRGGVGAGNQGAFAGNFAQLMAGGQAAGADAIDILEAIKNATETVVKSGVKLDLAGGEGGANFLRQMLSTGMGPQQAMQAGGGALANLAQAGGKPFENALSATVFSQLINQTDWNDPQSVKKLLGRTPDEIMGSGDPFQQQALQSLQRNPRGLIAQRFGAQLIGTVGAQTGAPLGPMQDTIRRMTGMAGPDSEQMATLLMAQMLHLQLPQASGVMRGIRGPMAPDITGALAPAPGTTPLDTFDAEVEKTTTVLRGMREQFDAISSRLGWINRATEGAPAGASAVGSVLGGGLFGGLTHFAGQAIRGVLGGGGGGGGGPGITMGPGAPAPGTIGPPIPPGMPAPGMIGPPMPPGLGRQGAAGTPARLGAAAGPGFLGRAGSLMRDLMGNFGISSAQAAGLVGNLGFESAGLTPGMQERGVKAPHGGLGYAQWTGPRRRAFEAWAAANNLSTSSEEANRGFLIHELATTDVGRRTLNALRGTGTVEEATWSVGQTFEHPRGTSPTNLPGYGSRLRWARQAFGALDPAASTVANRYDSGIQPVMVTGDVGAGAGVGGDGGSGTGFSRVADVHEAFGNLSRTVKETAEHLHDLGHGARSARHGLKGGHGPNTSTSTPNTQPAAAYP